MNGVFTNNQQMHFLTVYYYVHSTVPTCYDARASSARFCMPAELHLKHVQIYGIQ
jgi:hypothetical protein